MGKAKRFNSYDSDKRSQRQTKQNFGVGRQTPSVTSGIGSGNTGIGSSVSSPSVAGLLKTSGDTMIGPIAYYLVIKSIASDILDIGQGSGAYSSRVFINPQSGSADDLVTISGAGFNGQFLLLQPISGITITLKNSGNIVTITGNDFVLTGNNIIQLLFDASTNKWKMLTSGDASDASTWSTFVATQTVDMDTNKISNLVDPTADQDAATKIYVDSISAGTAKVDTTLGTVDITPANWSAPLTTTVT